MYRCEGRCEIGAESSSNHMCCFMRVLYTQFTVISRTDKKYNERITFRTCYFGVCNSNIKLQYLVLERELSIHTE